MNTVAIVDYGMCNLDSVKRAVEECGGRALVTDQSRDLERASRIILPGVGAFPDAMRNIKQRGLDEILREQVVEKEIPFLGICLGMQLLASRGWEIQETEGLDFVPGDVRRLEPYGDDTRIPHVGWNEVHLQHESPLFKGIASAKDFYFVHSYHLCPENEGDVLGRTPYGCGFVSAVQRGSVFGVQFHPEKSQRVGFQLLRNFLAI
jgi:glutamine amidotransferase